MKLFDHSGETSLSNMGIKGLKGWLCQHCKSAFRKRTVAPEALFVDLPAITYKYYRQSGSLKDGVATQKFYRGVISDVLKMVLKIKPSRLVYLGKDGVELPAKERAKTSRSERGPKRQLKSESMYFPDTKESFDRNMRAAIAQRRTAKQWANLDVVYDPSEAPKEAEQKFIDYLRCDENARNMSWVINTGDTDFILLTLALGMSDLWIASGDEMECNIGELRREIAKLGDGTDACVDDFVFLMSMVENDFLPGIKSIDAILRAYQQISGHLVTGGRINTDALKELWKKLDDRPISGGVGARQRCMAECYIQGLHWFANLYFGVCADWGWSYPFQGKPSIQSLITCLEGFVAPVPDLKPVPMKVHYRKAHAEATDEQVTAAFQKVFGDSLDDVLASNPDQRMSEVKARVYKDERTMDALVSILGEPVHDKDIPVTSGLLWVYKGANEERVILDLPGPGFNVRASSAGAISGIAREKKYYAILGISVLTVSLGLMWLQIRRRRK